ncbi:MAG: glycogen/starch/alpha-glucan phosphorylase [Steroidobacteraceae bacterium]|nr:glycogen/starch/alpha-glucan phosphorylase [Steroidobacteraceae bacterium]
MRDDFPQRGGQVLTVGNLRSVLLERMTRSLGRDPHTASPRDFYDALSLALREELTSRWLATQRRVAAAHVKRVCYLSVEFLTGRSLMNALASLDGELQQEAREVIAGFGLDLEALAQLEVDPGLGNGGLGRLAACFLDSLATLGYPAVGYGIRYDYGIFTQVIGPDGGQREVASSWLRLRNPWEIPRADAQYRVRFGGRCEAHRGPDGRERHRWVDTSDLLAVGFDHLVPGNRSPTVNHLRLWSGRSVTPFHIEDFNAGHYAAAVESQVAAKNVSRVLYPDDSTPQGRELRLRQQYFFVSASLQDLLATHVVEGRSLADLPDSVAIQLNDTHPTLAIPELMRLLVDEHDMEWEQAWDITRRTFSYTNHTLLPEALETWPVAMFERLLPRHLQIIYLINRDFLLAAAERFPHEHGRFERLSIIDESHGRQVRMSHLAVVGSRRVNGVARLHSELMTKTIFADLAQMYPGRFTNVTNGIAVRRWLKQSNPGLSALITGRLGHAWENDLDELDRLRPAAGEPGFREQVRAIKLENKRRLAAVIGRRCGIAVDPESLFDVQVKRIHEYKRQVLNLLHVIARYNRIRSGADPDPVPRTVMFAGKAAPGYALAKCIIRLINNAARVINADPAVEGRLKVVFLPDYDVSLAQQIMPAADLSQQISTAGMEASGTGNMKLALNGALTIGTLDGANIEIRERVGAENMFVFGLDADGVVALRSQGYVPHDYVQGDPELAEALRMIEQGYFNPDNADAARPIVNRLLGLGEPYLVLADFSAYGAAQDEVDRVFREPDEWSRRAAINILSMGPFSSDRSVREYAEDIWAVRPVI